MGEYRFCPGRISKIYPSIVGNGWPDTSDLNPGELYVITGCRRLEGPTGFLIEDCPPGHETVWKVPE